MDAETNPEQVVAEMRSRIHSDLLAQAEAFEGEATAALEETRGMQSLAAREAALAAELRALATRITEQLTREEIEDVLRNQADVDTISDRASGDLLDRADTLEYEASAALSEAEALHAMAKRQAALAAELRSLAARITER
jgi:hypothetical protein